MFVAASLADEFSASFLGYLDWEDLVVDPIGATLAVAVWVQTSDSETYQGLECMIQKLPPEFELEAH